MKKICEWENQTDQHGNGVCEAATMLWLSRLDMLGLEYALKLKATDCDELQALVEKGAASWAWTLPTKLGNGSSFDFDNKVEVAVATLSALESGDFLYISASSGAQGHAMAICKHRMGVFFFNPGDGIYLAQDQQEINELVEHIKNDEHFGVESSARKGSLRSHGYKLDRFFGG